MKFKSNIKIKQLGGESILVSHDSGNLDYTRVITLNESAEYLIGASLEDKTISPEIWRDMLMAKYSIPAEQALADATALIEKLKTADVFE